MAIKLARESLKLLIVTALVVALTVVGVATFTTDREANEAGRIVSGKFTSDPIVLAGPSGRDGGGGQPPQPPPP